MGKAVPADPDLIEYVMCHDVWPGTTPAQLEREDPVKILRHYHIYKQQQNAVATRNGLYTKKREVQRGKNRN